MVWLAPCLCQFPAPQGCHIGSHVKSLIDEGEAGIKKLGDGIKLLRQLGRLAETTVRAAAKATCDPILKDIVEGSYDKLSHEVSMYSLSHEETCPNISGRHISRVRSFYWPAAWHGRPACERASQKSGVTYS